MHQRFYLFGFPFLLIISGCAQSTQYPSLAKRSFEVAAPLPEPEPVIQLPADADTRTRIATALQAARGGVGAFQQALGKARADAAAADGSAKGSDAWINAQLSLSRAQSTLGPASSALADVDGEKRRLAMEHGESVSMSEIDAALAELSALASSQSDEVQTVAARLSR